MGKYYDGTKLLSMKDINGNKPEIYICTTNRTGGKTTYFGRLCVNRWIEKGEKARSGKYKQFYLEMQKAKSKFKEHHLRKIAEAKDWRASQYLLQVTDSETYVVTEKKQVNADVKTDLLEKLQRPLPELKEE